MLAAVGSLIPAYIDLHKRGKFPGYSIERYVPKIARLVERSGARTLLDFGCGAGRQYLEKRVHDSWGGLMPWLYDPAVPAFNIKPENQFDGVICTDVLEHVPEAELDAVIADLVSYAKMWAFITVCCRPAKANKNLPGNVNAHVTIRAPDWWYVKLRHAFHRRAELHLEFTP